MKIVLIPLFLLCFCVLALGADDKIPPSKELSGHCEQLPLPPGKQGQISALAAEPEGTLWVIANGSLYYWTGQQYREPVGEKITTGYYLAALYGGHDRALYVTQRGPDEHQGKLYQLSDGRTIYVTDFYFEAGHESPGLYVSPSGQLFNWGNRFLAVYTQGKWQRIEALLNSKHTLVVEADQKVYFYYNRNLYSIDRQGQFEQREIVTSVETVPNRKRTHGALWGDDRLVIVEDGAKHIFAYYLEDGTPFDTTNINRHLTNQSVHDLFRAADGSIWVLVNDPELRRFVFLRITPDGKVAKIHKTSIFDWRNLRLWQFPHSVVNGSDGAIWFGTPRAGIARYRKGKLDLYGWQHGVAGDFRYLCEGAGGEIYAASPKGIYVFRPDMPPRQLPNWVNQWREYRLASSQPVRDHQGNIWMFLEDEPGRISRWDGSTWTHFDVPFGTRKVGRVMADDRGHILISMLAYPDGCYDISPEGVKRFDNLPSMLVAAVAAGAKQFSTENSFQGCFVLEGSKIWFGYQNYKGVHFFDGQRWDTMQLSDDIYYLYESPKYGILIRTQGGKYYTYDRGQLTEVPVSQYPPPTRWLLGPKSLQPFEEQLLKQRPGQYIPLERADDGKLHLLAPIESGLPGNSPPYDYQRVALLPDQIKTVTPGFAGGHWSKYKADPIYRLFGDRIIPCDFRQSPLIDRESGIRQVLEDRKRNLWFDAGRYSGAGHVFVKLQHDFELRAENVPSEAKHAITINAEAFFAGQPQSGTTLFWRFADGLWRGAQSEDSVTIDFPQTGRYEIELVAMGPLGGITPRPLSFTIRAQGDPALRPKLPSR